MNTRFQISTKPGPDGSPPFSKIARSVILWISEHGPHGPVSPICQKFSLSPSRKMRRGSSPMPSRHKA